MKYQWIDEYCLSKKGSEKDFKVEWNATRYLICGKMFVMQGGDKYKKEIITLKCDPQFGRALREQYEDIFLGYYWKRNFFISTFKCSFTER